MLPVDENQILSRIKILEDEKRQIVKEITCLFLLQQQQQLAKASQSLRQRSRSFDNNSTPHIAPIPTPSPPSIILTQESGDVDSLSSSSSSTSTPTTPTTPPSPVASEGKDEGPLSGNSTDEGGASTQDGGYDECVIEEQQMRSLDLLNKVSIYRFFIFICLLCIVYFLFSFLMQLLRLLEEKVVEIERASLAREGNALLAPRGEGAASTFLKEYH